VGYPNPTISGPERPKYLLPPGRYRIVYPLFSLVMGAVHVVVFIRFARGFCCSGPRFGWHRICRAGGEFVGGGLDDAGGGGSRGRGIGGDRGFAWRLRAGVSGAKYAADVVP